mgnify:CR=1 FL=1
MSETKGASALAAIHEGGKAALARALGRIESHGHAAETAALLDAALSAGRAHVIGLTGPPGVGKSTLTDALIRAFRARGETVGVVAVDPTSARSGGALLGDRTRLRRDAEDDGVFVRSMAARESLGGLAALVLPAVVLMAAVRDVVIVETVGVGQSETAIAGIADTVVFCVQPGSGDALQFMKAGVMEIPDIAVVTKADMGDVARRAVSDLRGALSLGGAGEGVPVMSCSASAGEGVDDLVAALGDRARATGSADARRAQAAEWLTAELGEEFGRTGLRRLAPGLDLARSETPFARAAGVRDEICAILSRIAPERG